MKKTGCIIFMIFTSVACQKSSTFTEKEKKEIIDTIQNTLKNYYTDIEKNGLTAEFKYLDNSPDFFWVPPGYVNSISYDSVKNVLTQNAPIYSSIQNSWDSLYIQPLSPSIASYTGKIHSIIVDTTGKITDLHLIETGVLIKRKNGWKLLNGQTSIIH